MTGVAAGASASVCKLPEHLDCVVDRRLLAVSVPYFDAVHTTPNTLTAISGVLQICACALLAAGCTKTAAFVWFAGYYFDVVDGAYARYHRMTSDYGDVFDHIKDWVCSATLAIVALWCFAISTSQYLCLLAIAVSVSVYMGLLESWTHTTKPGSESRMLAPLRRMVEYASECDRVMVSTALSYFRFVGGSGIANLYLCAWIATLE